MVALNPDFKPPADYKPPATRVSDKVMIPQDEYPEINFVGLLIGPRWVNAILWYPKLQGFRFWLYLGFVVEFGVVFVLAELCLNLICVRCCPATFSVSK